MGAERVNQIEFDVSNSLKVNLKTGRLLFTYNLLNLFKDEYNLNLDLIYNHKNELNPNMNPFLGSFFRLDINEYIQRTGNLIYYIDSLDRYYLAENYYETSTEIHKRFNNEIGLTLIVYKNDNTKIVIKDDKGNTKEFNRLSNQSENTYYYVLTKKIVKYNNTTSISYFYNYDSNNKLVSMYNSLDQSRIINFKYNSIGLLNHIYMNYSNKINGVKFKYNSNFDLICIKKITNSIEEIDWLLYYENNQLKKLLNYISKESFEFSYDNNKLTESKIGYTNLTIKESNNLYASEATYTSDLIIDNYVKDDIEIYDISNIVITSKEKYTFSYDTNTYSTLVTKVNSLNSAYDLPVIYNYDGEGREVSHFEVLYNNINRLKNVSIVNGVDLIGDGPDDTIKINGNNVISDYCNDTYNDFDSDSLDDFLNYHDVNINKFNSDYIVYDINSFIKLYLIYQNTYIVFKVYYSDNNVIEYPIRLSLRNSSEFQIFSSSILLRRKEINDIKYKVISSNSSNHYSLSNMYLSLGSMLNIEYADLTNLYSINSLTKFKVKKQGEADYTEFKLIEGEFLTQSDLINNFKNYLYYKYILNYSYFIFNYNNNEKKLRATDVKYLYEVSNNVYNEIIISNNNRLIIRNNNYNVNSVNETVYSFKTSITKGVVSLSNVIEIKTTNTLNSVTTYEYAYYDLFDKLILTVDEYGIIKYYNYDNYNRVVSEQSYNNTTLLKNITNTYLLLEEKSNDGFSYTRECFDNFGLKISEGVKSVNDANYTNIYYNRNDKNNVVSVTNTNTTNNHINFIRYNEKNEVISEYYKNNNEVVNNYSRYDNYGRLTKYYRYNKLVDDYDNILEKVCYTYNDSFNKVSEQINYSNALNEIIESNYDKYDRLISIKENNVAKLNLVYDTISEKLNLIQDYYKSTYTNYSYLDNKVDEVIEYDFNDNELLKIKRIDSDTNKGINYTINNNINLSYVYSNDLNKTINPRLSNILNTYFNKTFTYDNIGRLTNTLTNIKNIDIYNYYINTINSYLENNSLITYLKEEVVNESYINLNLKNRFSFNYSYFAKNNMVSNYTLTKSVLNNDVSSFKNKFEFNYSYNDALEVSQDTIIRYDVNNNVIKYNENNYTYDTCGNILSVNKKEGSTPSTITTNTTNLFSYYDGNLQSVYNTLTDYYKEYSYDYYGNIINIKHYDNHDNLLKEEVFTYTRKSLIDTYRLFENNILTKSFKYYYNYQGIRYKKEDLINNIVTEYILDEDRILGIYVTNGANIKRYYYLYDETGLIGFNYNNKTYYYIRNELNDIVGLICDGIEITRYIYDAFGNLEVYKYNSDNDLIIDNDSNSIGNINPFRYKGYNYDIESGLYYLQTRYYSSNIGRFISPDSIDYLDGSNINGLNLYCYCNNNPVDKWDPSGHFFMSALLIGALVGGIIGVAASVISQGLTNGWDNINGWQALLDGTIGATSGLISATGIGALGAALISGGLGFVGSVGGDLISSNMDWSSVNWGKAAILGVVNFGLGAWAGAGSQNSAALGKGLIENREVNKTFGILYNATNNYLVGNISKRGFSGVFNLYGNQFINAVSKALPGTVARLTAINLGKLGASSIISTCASIGLNYCFSLEGVRCIT